MPQAATARAYSLRTLLVAFGGLIALPLLVLLGIFFLRSSTLERQQVEQHLIQVAEDLADDIDRDLDRHITVLRALTSSPAFKNNDWPAFYRQAQTALAGQAGVIVIDSGLRQLVNTLASFGEQPERTGDPATARRVLDTKQLQISNVFTGIVTKQPALNIDMPIFSDGKVSHIAILALEPDDFASILSGQKLQDTWVGSIWDSNDVIIKNTLEPEMTGQKLPEELSRKTLGTYGLHRTISVYGDEQVWRAIASSELSGWRVSVAAPAAEIEGPLQHSAWLWGGSLAIAIVLTALFAWLFARTLSQPMQNLAKAARALGRGEPLPPMEASLLAEANTVSAVLQRSQEKLQRRSAALRARTAELETLLKLSPAATLVAADPQCQYISPNDAAAALFGVEKSDNVSQSAQGESAEIRLKRDGVELALDDMPMQRAAATGEPVTEPELEILCPDGRTVYVTGGAVPLFDEHGEVRGAMASFIDITERKRLEQRRDLLLNELAHRGKNLLAVIQSIAMRSFPKSKQREAFIARLQSLSRTYAALNVGDFQGAPMAVIVANEIGAFASRAEIAGPDLVLNDKAAQTMALVLHELATNAIKYGAWSRPEGVVAVTWAIETGGEAPRFAFRWRERGGPPVKPPTRRGFGSTLTTRAVALEFGTEPDESFAAAGYAYGFSAPLAAVAMRHGMRLAGEAKLMRLHHGQGASS